MSNHDARKLDTKAQARVRRQVVQAVDEGMTHAEAARVFGIHRGTVTRWCSDWWYRGDEVFEPGKRGRPPQAALAGHQAATIVKLITDRCPDQLKLSFALWTREAVRELIYQRYDTWLSLPTVGRYLHRWGVYASEAADARV